MTLLSLTNISASYGLTQALFGVNLTIEPGEVVALMGRNGMGKSTTVKVICRLLNHQSGTIEFDGADIGAISPFRAARLGLGLVPEGRRCFTNLTVSENLFAAARPGPWDVKTIAELFPKLAERQDQLAASLSGGEQQMLAIGRALTTNPRLLLLDEATEGLAPIIRQEIWAAIGELKRNTGLAIIVVDKSLKELAGIADKAVVLEKGVSVWAGDFANMTPDVTNQYLGV